MTGKSVATWFRLAGKRRERLEVFEAITVGRYDSYRHVKRLLYTNENAHTKQPYIECNT